jgi:hypothetical protein
MLTAFRTPFPAAPYSELFGRLVLANVDVSVRLHYLVSRLAVGVAESGLRNQVLMVDDGYFAADRAELRDRVMVVLEAGAEGCMTILRSYIDEVTDAQSRCLKAAFGMAGCPGAEAPALRLPLAPAAAAPGGRARQGAGVFSARG